MGERDPQIDVDIAALGLSPALAQLITSMQDTIASMDQRFIELSAGQAEELAPFTDPEIRLRGGKGITLEKRGRNSWEVSLTNAPVQPDLQLVQLLVTGEEDNHLECQTLDGREENVMKPFDLQRQVYGTVETNFTTDLQYENLGVNRRRAFLNSDPTNEEFQIITRSYSASPYILAARSFLFHQPLTSGSPTPPLQMEYKLMDLNVTGRSWAVDPDGGP